MPRHIHTPEMPDWVSFLANTAEIDGYSISENELYRIRASPTPRKLALSLTNCANTIWECATSVEPVCVSVIARNINETVVEGAKEENFIQSGADTSSFWRARQPLIDSDTSFQVQDIPQFMSSLDECIKEFDSKAIDYLERGFSPMVLQRELGMVSWLTQFQFGYTCPFPCLNGLTGRFLTNCLRLRWSMTLWRCDLKTGVWESNLNQCKQLWKKLSPEEIVKPLMPEGYKPSLEKPEILAPQE